MILSFQVIGNDVHDDREHKKISGLASSVYLETSEGEPLIQITIPNLRSIQDNPASGNQEISFTLSESSQKAVEINGHHVAAGNTTDFIYQIEDEGKITLPVKLAEDDPFGVNLNYSLYIDKVESELDYREINPPARYTSVYNCPSGSTYNIDSNQCLTSIDCNYDQAHYYKVAKSTGVSINDGETEYQSLGLKQCAPITKGETVYTCGELQVEDEFATEYAICTNKLIDTSNKHCPDQLHILNPATGYCEVPPPPTCPDGVPLVEGDDPWSNEDDKCLLAVPATPTCNDSNAKYDDATSLCVSSGVEYSDLLCEEGYSLSGSTCVKTVSNCIFQPLDYTGFTPPAYVWTENVGGSTNFYMWGSSGSMWGASGYPAKPPGNLSRGDLVRKRYNPIDGSYFYDYYICDNTNISEPAYCPIGASIEDNQCKSVIDEYSSPTKVCSVEGSFYDETTDTCRIEEPAQLSCPAAYPNWIESEKRCSSL